MNQRHYSVGFDIVTSDAVEESVLLRWLSKCVDDLSHGADLGKYIAGVHNVSLQRKAGLR